MLTVAKFGGSSLADALRFLRVREIIQSDISRRVVVVSAAGRRHSGDQKITDLLYLCHAHLQHGVSCWELWRRVAARYIEIRDGCGLQLPIEQELEAIYAALSSKTERAFLASRGEYLSARLMAELLHYEFLDAASWLRFDRTGNVLKEESYAALQSLADGRCIVTPGFYGAHPDGSIHTFSRGGSDVTGSLAAAALHADVYENWTDVPGVLAADPAVISNPEPIPSLSYGELQTLSSVGMQVLHESAVEPVREKDIPMRICSTLHPELPGTQIGNFQHQRSIDAPRPYFAGQRKLTMLRAVFPPGRADSESMYSVAQILRDYTLDCVYAGFGVGSFLALLQTPLHSEPLQHVCTAMQQALFALDVQIREDQSLLAALYGNGAASKILQAIQDAGIPVQPIALTDSCLLLIVHDSQYEDALRAAYAAF